MSETDIRIEKTRIDDHEAIEGQGKVLTSIALHRDYLVLYLGEDEFLLGKIQDSWGSKEIDWACWTPDPDDAHELGLIDFTEEERVNEARRAVQAQRRAEQVQAEYRRLKAIFEPDDKSGAP